MIPVDSRQQRTEWSYKDAAEFLLKWTPRALVVACGAYYGLGVAYEIGLMAAIDRVAIQILKQWVGYIGIGALMPTVQWYSALAVRCCMSATAALLYNVLERIGQAAYRYLSVSCES